MNEEGLTVKILLQEKATKEDSFMRYTLVWLLIFFVLSLTGCAELKQLRIETAEQKTTIEQLNAENKACQEALAKTLEELKTTQGELEIQQIDLKTKELELEQKEAAAREQSEAFKRMQEAMKAELASKQVALKELEGKLTLTMVESILFDSGKADVKEEGRQALQKVADVLKNIADQEIIVAGYTDNVQIGGNLARIYPTNWELSAARAISVVKILVDDGVDPGVLGACGYSEYRPVADNETPEGRAENRRMEIILMPKLKQ
jgi:chemotaxis protein MotB